MKQRETYLEDWGTFLTQQHVVVGTTEISRPDTPVTTPGVDDSESIIDL